VPAYAALGSSIRWSIFKMLASGQELSASMVASALKRDFDGVSKHLRVMRDAGVVAWRLGEDKRFTVYFIPAANRPEPGVVDYGFCRLRLPPG
jgi:hypothetical protein